MRRLAILLAALAALGLPAAAGAAEPWGPARTLAGAGGPFTPVVAVDDRGYALAAWERVNGRSDVLAARRTPARAFGGPFPIDATGGERAGSPAVGFVDRTGYVVHRRGSGGDEVFVVLRTVGPDGGRSRPVALSEPGRFPGAPATDRGPDGELLLWWGERSLRGAVLAFTRVRVDGSVEPVQRLELGEAREVVAALGPGGGVLAAFISREVTGRFPRVLVRSLGEDASAFGPAQAVSDGSRNPRELQIDVAFGGRAAVAWTASSGENEHVIAAQRSGVGTTFGAEEVLDGGAGFADQLALTATADGDLLAAWSAPGADRAVTSADGPVRLAEIGGNGGPARTVTRAGVEADSVTLTAGGRGGATLAFIQDVGGRGPVRAVAITRTERLGRVQRLSVPGERPVGLTLAAGPRGDAVALWVEQGNVRLRTARRPA
jgi:hypothetical protein